MILINSLIIIISLSLIIWLFLLLFWGKFWLANQRIEQTGQKLESYPNICAVIPARDEADVLATSLASLLNQDYLGKFSIVLVDDNSRDRTYEIAKETAVKFNQMDKLNVISAQPLAIGWKGKLWAIKQGIEYAQKQENTPDYFLLTDADIKHDPHNLSQLVTKAKLENLDLVSLMVLLRCESIWEKILIPAFVFFFQKLYPFAWVNNSNKTMAAAAGGCILISSKALKDIGGIESISQALIDDCALAKAVKSKQKKIWLGLSETTISLRAYDNLKTIWEMIARTAFTQLNYSLLLLIGTIIGMSILYLAAPIYLLIGIFTSNWLIITIALVSWLLMTIAYLPTIRLYKISILWAICLPAIAFLYTLMTIDSAVKYWQGKGGAWKGRTYNQGKLI
jgi:hopene-associated glycosyltransferase HpnB